MTSAISFEAVQCTYPGSNRPAVRDVSFDVPPGDLVVLLGPSGCGKTTLLKTVNRLVEPVAGRVLLEGEDVRSGSPTALRRRIGYVIQAVGLFPHLTVAENIAVVPELLGWARTRIGARIDELLALVNLPPAEYRARFPRQLSGGEGQRVGLARALAADPAFLLMDEPFGAIDAINREHLQAALLEIQRHLKKTILFVTHDVEEAVRLADRIAVLRAGHLVQYAEPLELLRRPADAFVAELVGAGDLFRRLSLVRVGAIMAPVATDSGGRTVGLVPRHSGIGLHPEDDARAALTALLAAAIPAVPVVDDTEVVVGQVSLDDVRAALL